MAVAQLFVRSMLIAALDMGMRQGEMLALRVRACHPQTVKFLSRMSLITLSPTTPKEHRTPQLTLRTIRI